MILNQDEVRRYLGYGKSKPDAQTRDDLEHISREMEDTIQGRWVYEVLKTDTVTEDLVTFRDSPIVLHGKQIARLLKDCSRVYVMACTLGAQADRMIELKGFLSPTLGMVTDACASAYIESWCDQCQEEIAKSLEPGEKLTFRFSPGYGDLPLSDQKAVLAELQAEKRIGLFLTESFLMTPRKSVVALLGVLPPDKEKGTPNQCGHAGCTECPLSEDCSLPER
ncbi:MAG TPA: vitamin B12 dependent-methionine synthase activation domain-containing protein [Clostridiaceae bacterium]|nr:vitamin B12 dependent-methionine synthase activation domain-containing protein [Clostridiaceae bacterium]